MNPGQTLKDKRNQMGLSINDVAVATKINPRILKALEEGQKENLPPRSFVRGFIRSYANYLKLNSEEILQAFETEEGITPAVTNDVTSVDGKETPNKSSRDDISRMEQSSRLGTIMVTAGIVVLIVLIFGVKKMMDRYAQERVVEPAKVEGEAENVETAVNESTTNPAGDEAPDAKVAADEKAPVEAAATNSNPAATVPAPVVAAPPPATPPPPPAPVAATPPPAPAPPPAPVVAPPPPPVVAAPPPVAPAPAPAAVTPPKPTGTPQEIIVEALDQVELTVAIDGGGTKKITLKPESVHTIKALKEVVLEVSDGGLVNIIQNGNDRGNPGQLGKAAKLKYP